MPSHCHQALLLWASRRMLLDGFRLVAYDGQSAQGGRWNSLPAPAIVGGVRPDAWGVSAGGCLGVAEAKTADDVDTYHTRCQLRALTRLDTFEHPLRLYVAVPRSAARALDRVLADLEFVGVPHIVRLHIPDVLLTVAS